ncbi:hypothetical protein J2Z65_004734 [Paenibacillus aceris]|uniref:Uncharacterized protein n=1 Tax=Paenibacillus aceris TaxID=869555 RepID=A0ABS4I514_9BACL|nr:hypothetical protein [Paenibacillus aceris]
MPGSLDLTRFLGIFLVSIALKKAGLFSYTYYLLR